ncbi:MAG: hypothetical protein AAF621_01840 [Pseudomonadota bacterium]
MFKILASLLLSMLMIGAANAGQPDVRYLDTHVSFDKVESFDFVSMTEIDRGGRRPIRRRK